MMSEYGRITLFCCYWTSVRTFGFVRERNSSKQTLQSIVIWKRLKIHTHSTSKEDKMIRNIRMAFLIPFTARCWEGLVRRGQCCSFNDKSRRATIRTRVSWADAVKYHFSPFTGLVITFKSVSAEDGTFLENQVNTKVSDAWFLGRSDICSHAIGRKENQYVLINKYRYT